MMIDDCICKSIKDLRKLEIHYKNDLKRIIEPHAYGYDKNNNKLLSAYQTLGFSTTGNIPNWRLFKIEHIKYITELNEHFQPIPDYNPLGYDYMKIIVCQI